MDRHCRSTGNRCPRRPPRRQRQPVLPGSFGSSESALRWRGARGAAFGQTMHRLCSRGWQRVRNLVERNETRQAVTVLSASVCAPFALVAPVSFVSRLSFSLARRAQLLSKGGCARLPCPHRWPGASRTVVSRELLRATSSHTPPGVA